MIESPSFIVRKIRVSKKERGLALDLDSFGAGLNLIQGVNSSGRTTLLKLIEFALGTQNIKRTNFIPEINDCDRVVLEVLINSKPFTFERQFKHSGQVSIYLGEIDQFPRPYPENFLAGQQISDFILNKLGIPSIALVDELTGNTKSISFEDVYSALYIDQDTGFSKIHARLSASKRINVFKLLTKISSPEAYELAINEDSLKKQKKKFIDYLSAIEQFLGDIRLPMANELKFRFTQLSEEKQQLVEELNEIKQQIRSQPTYIEPLRNEVLELEQNLGNQNQERSFIRQNLQSYETLENQLLSELDKSERVQSSSYLLLSFDFQQCPRCLQAITNEMQRREDLDQECSLCGRDLIEHDDPLDDLETYRKQIEAQLDELEELKQQYKQKLTTIEQSIEDVEMNLATKRVELDNLVSQYVAPVIRNIEILSKQISEIDRELAQLKDYQLMRSKAQEVETELDAIDQQLDVMKEEREFIKEKEKRAEAKLVHFESFLQEFLADTSPETIANVKINRRDFLPIINDLSYDSKSATERNIAIIGYFYALLRFSLEQSTHIPRFLVIDTLRQDDMERDTYEKVLLKFAELNNQYPKQFQILMVIQGQVDKLRRYEKLNLSEGKHLLNL